MAIPNIKWKYHLEGHPNGYNNSYLVDRCENALIHSPNSGLAKFLDIINNSNFHWQIVNTLDFSGYHKEGGVEIGIYFYSKEFMRLKCVFYNRQLDHCEDLINPVGYHYPMSFENVTYNNFRFTNNDRKVLEFLQTGLTLSIANNGSLCFEFDGNSKCYTPEECLKTDRLNFKVLGIEYNLSIINYQKMIKDAYYFSAAIYDEFKISSSKKMFGNIGNNYKVTDGDDGNFNDLWNKFVERISLDDGENYKEYLVEQYDIQYPNKFKGFNNFPLRESVAKKPKSTRNISDTGYYNDYYDGDYYINYKHPQTYVFRNENGPVTKWINEY